MAPVIVFGPTGQIGSVTAITASSLGADVWLAMRDTSKTIPGLSKEQENSGSFQRVQADLSNPETLAQAIQTSGAKRAFIYLLHTSPDHQLSALKALKEAGVEFVVFVSSFTIETDKPLRSIAPTEIIPYIHAQVEANLDDVFGESNYVAVRPGAFASNLSREAKAIAAGHVELPFGGVFEQDNIAPSDIGRVCGSILVSGPKNGQSKVYLYGPEVLSLADGYVRIGKVLGKEVRVSALSEERSWEKYRHDGLPEVFAEYMMRIARRRGEDKGNGEVFPRYEEGVGNVELYTGRKATGFDEWVRENEAAFA